MKRLAVAVFGLMASVNLLAENYTKIGETQKQVFYVDKDSVKRSDLQNKNYVGIWTKSIYKNQNGNNPATDKVMFWFNCPMQTISFPTQIIEFGKNGEAINSFNNSLERTEFQDVVPDSIQDSMYTIACLAAFKEDYLKLGVNPSPLDVKKFAEKYPVQIKELQKYLK